jgi:dipeptidyl aminopeptidase/acylaminoacyl peptidase
MLDSSPQFSPDGNRIAFRNDRSGSNEIWTANVDGTNQRQITHFAGPLTGSPRWSPDGAYLAFDSRGTGNPDIYIIPADGGGARRFTADAASDVVPSWSRDGKSIYFASDRGGKWQVWKQDVAGGEAHQVPKGGGFLALESPMNNHCSITDAILSLVSGAYLLPGDRSRSWLPSGGTRCRAIGASAPAGYFSSIITNSPTLPMPASSSSIFGREPSGSLARRRRNRQPGTPAWRSRRMNAGFSFHK